MNIMDLEIGESGVDQQGVRYTVLRDDVEKRPGVGHVTVRTTTDQDGTTHKFIRGIEVERRL